MGHSPDIEALSDFVAVAEAGGVTAGAHRRGQPKQTVSRRLMALERDLGVRLFDRSTRSLRLTEEGALLLARARPVIEELRDIGSLLADRSTGVRGTLRVSAPVLLGQSLMGALAARVLAAHPDLLLRIELSDRRVDLIEDGYDAAIRVGESDEAGLIGRRLALADTVLVASPEWVAWHGPIDRPQDLAEVACVLFGPARSVTTWRLSPADGGEATTMAVTGRLSCDSLRLCLDAAVASAGVASVPAFIARPLIASGQLARVLPGWTTGRVAIRIVHPSRRLVPPRLRVFIDEAVAAFARSGFEAEGAGHGA